MKALIYTLAAGLGIWGVSLLAMKPIHADELGSLLRSQLQALLRDEYEVTRRALQKDLSLATGRTKALETQMSEAVKRAQTQATEDRHGIELMKQLDQLFAARYVDKKGNFQVGLEISEKDVRNVNDLFTTHLSMAPLSGRISAGYARRTLTWGRERLDDIAGMHESPSESNNPEVEIIAKQLRDEQAKSEKTLKLAESLKLTLDANAAAPAEMISTSAALNALSDLEGRDPAAAKNKKKGGRR